MSHFLANDPQARVLIIAGFHTGRPKVANFFEIIGDTGLEVDRIWEMDSSGERRAWDPKRPMGPGEGKKWVVVAVLKRKLA
jgi:nicotinamide N-methyltransferase